MIHARGVCPLLALLLACATPAPTVPSAEARALLTDAAVVAGQESPEIEFEGFAHGRLEGAGIGAASTFAGCVGALGGGGSCQGAMCGAVVILWLGVCTVSSAVGGVVGAVIAPSAESVRTAEGQLHAALDVNAMQDSLRDEVLASAREGGSELASVAPERAAARVEVALTRVGTEGSGIDPPLLVFMDARARILRTSDGAQIYSADYRYEGEKRTLRGWSENRGAPLLHALEAGYESLGAEIFGSVFRLLPFPDREVHRSGLFGATFGLAPLDPKDDDVLAEPWLGTRKVGRRPELRWQSFPRASDFAAQPDAMSRVRNVRYDLVIARERDSAAALVVYRREGLPAPHHRLEERLAPASQFLWTVRARFELDGRTQWTEWSGTGPDPDPHSSAPPRTSFRIRTP